MSFNYRVYSDDDSEMLIPINFTYARRHKELPILTEVGLPKCICGIITEYTAIDSGIVSRMYGCYTRPIEFESIQKQQYALARSVIKKFNPSLIYSTLMCKKTYTNRIYVTIDYCFGLYYESIHLILHQDPENSWCGGQSVYIDDIFKYIATGKIAQRLWESISKEIDLLDEILPGDDVNFVRGAESMNDLVKVVVHEIMLLFIWPHE